MHLNYGNPVIGKASINEDCFEVEILVPGLEDEKAIVEFDEKSLKVEVSEDSRYTKKFSVVFDSEDVDFREADVWKDNGVLYIWAPVHEERVNGKTTITL